MLAARLLSSVEILCNCSGKRVCVQIRGTGMEEDIYIGKGRELFSWGNFKNLFFIWAIHSRTAKRADICFALVRVENVTVRDRRGVHSIPSLSPLREFWNVATWEFGHAFLSPVQRIPLPVPLCAVTTSDRRCWLLFFFFSSARRSSETWKMNNFFLATFREICCCNYCVTRYVRIKQFGYLRNCWYF